MDFNTQNTDAAIPNSVLDDFSRWKSFLGDKVEHAHAAGVSDRQITEFATRMGSFLADKVDPANPQERLLKQMWDVSDREDQKAIARAMVNLVQRDTTRH